MREGREGEEKLDVCIPYSCFGLRLGLEGSRLALVTPNAPRPLARDKVKALTIRIGKTRVRDRDCFRNF